MQFHDQNQLQLPLIFYFFVGSFIAPILTSLQISNDILLAVIGFVYLIVISYSSQEASSQSKYFKKALERSNSTESEPEENREISDSSKVTKRRGTCFFIHVAGNLVAIAMWIFLFPEEFSESIGEPKTSENSNDVNFNRFKYHKKQHNF